MGARTQRRWIAVAAAVVVGGPVAYLLVSRHRDEARRAEEAARRVEAGMAWQAFEDCLYGGPLPDGDVPSERLAAIELCADPARPDPSTCKKELTALSRAWDALGISDDNRSSYSNAKLDLHAASEWEQGRGWPWWAPRGSGKIDEITDAVRVARLPLAPRAAPKLHCTARAEVPFDGTRYIGRTSSDPARTEDVHGAALRVVWSDGYDNLACWLPADGAARARCGTRLKTGARPFDADASLEDFVVHDPRPGDDPSVVLVRPLSDTELTWTARPVDVRGWADSGGGATTLDLGAETIVYTRSEGRGSTWAPPAKAKLPDRERIAWREIHTGWVVGYTEEEAGEPSSAEVHVFAQRIAPEAQLVGEPVDLGTMRSPRAVRGCSRPGGGVTLAFISAPQPGREPHWQTYDLGVAVARGADLEPLVVTPVELPRVELGSTAGNAPDPFACAPDGRPRWAFERGGIVHDVTCARGKCITSRSGPLGLTGGVVAVSPLGADRALVVEGSVLRRELPLPPIHRVRARVAKVTELAEAPWRLVAVHVTGAIFPWESVSTFARGDVGWVIARSSGVIYAFRLGADGHFEPVARAP